MITKNILKKLMEEKLKDAEILINKNRYGTGFYIGGYVIELFLKLQICKVFKFWKGYPEDDNELKFYKNNSRINTHPFNAIKKVKDLKIHNLNDLLYYSGIEYKIKSILLSEWNLIENWSPNIRYKIIALNKDEALNKIKAIKLLIKA